MHYNYNNAQDYYTQQLYIVDEISEGIQGMSFNEC